MKKANWMKTGMIAILTVLSAACGRGGVVAGRTYVATTQGYNGMQSGYACTQQYPNNCYGNNGGYGYPQYGYNNGYGYNGYNGGYGNMQGGTGDTVSFDNNMRATYRQASLGTTVTGTYSYLDSSNTSLQLIPDAGAQNAQMMNNQPIRFTVANDGSYITNQNNGQVMYRQ